MKISVSYLFLVACILYFLNVTEKSLPLTWLFHSRGEKDHDTEPKLSLFLLYGQCDPTDIDEVITVLLTAISYTERDLIYLF